MSPGSIGVSVIVGSGVSVSPGSGHGVVSTGSDGVGDMDGDGGSVVSGGAVDAGVSGGPSETCTTIDLGTVMI